MRGTSDGENDKGGESCNTTRLQCHNLQGRVISKDETAREGGEWGGGCFSGDIARDRAIFCVGDLRRRDCSAGLNFESYPIFGLFSFLSLPREFLFSLCFGDEHRVYFLCMRASFRVRNRFFRILSASKSAGRKR